MDELESEKNRLAPEYLWGSLAEAYAEGWCGLHVHFRAGTVEGGIAGDWCAAFYRAGDGLDVVGGQVVGDEEGDALRREKDDMGQPMLVLDVKPVELPKGVYAEPLLSLVRLQLLDDCLRTWVNPPESFVEFCRSIGALFREDREPGFVSDGLGQAIPHVGDGEFQGEVVKGGSEVVDTVSNNWTKVGRGLVAHFEPRELVEVINIEVRPSSVRVFLAPDSHFGFKAIQVIERPVEPSFMVEDHTNQQYAKRRGGK